MSSWVFFQLLWHYVQYALLCVDVSIRSTIVSLLSSSYHEFQKILCLCIIWGSESNAISWNICKCGLVTSHLWERKVFNPRNYKPPNNVFHNKSTNICFCFIMNVISIIIFCIVLVYI
ncbi:hypothetical protein XELAEV_18013479mg [Xenopus laevis]|uniref:Uncharacterized protein n=1 Tax=Xenopus laevis TaxID=8355 RepID=A0A974HZN4_XENLA|nr:hypothetical protein XELAEV_18013479mg [Xenopus laevis]